MVSTQGRISAFCENGFGEPEQDANSALTELDKGLRSARVGEQCEAIVRFPRLLEKYPFPILINSAMLKLADVFRMGTNFLRLWVLRVCQQSEKHLDKILNIDEFVRRIFSVIHSNDPIARALTLRTLGSIAVIIPERKQVHHCIHNSLDSHDKVEVEAAIYASGKFAEKSKTFSVNMCSKIGDMIQGLATPVELKLRLLPILQHMHHDAQTAATVRTLCTSLLPSYPAQDFVVVTLHTLTNLAAATLVDIPPQVELLLQYLCEDPRQEVKERSLQDLLVLANKAAHLWRQADIQKVVTFALETPYDGGKVHALAVLHSLAKSPADSKFDLSPGSSVLTLCSRSCYCDNIAVASKAVEMLSHLAIHSPDLVPEAVMAIESLLVVVVMGDTPMHLKATKVGLSCAVALCSASPAVSSQFVDSIGGILTSVEGKTRTLLCEALGAIGNMQHDVLRAIFPDLISIFEGLIQNPDPDEDNTHTMVMMSTLLFQIMKGHLWNPKEEEIIMKVVGVVNLWSAYRIGRSAARYGHHHIASYVFGKLVRQVVSEPFCFWLESLKQLSQGEASLRRPGDDNLVRKLNMAINHYMKGTSALKAASTPAFSLQFQYEYARLRGEILQDFLQLVHVCRTIRTSPPPAVAASLALEDPQRCGRITYQVRKSVKNLQHVSELYGKLHHSAFDADPETLINIQIMQQICFYLAQSMENMLLKNQSAEEDIIGDFEFGFSLMVTKCNIETQGLIDACQQAAAILKRLNPLQGLKPIDFLPKFVDRLLEAVTVLIQTPLTFPRFFFQTLQSTSIKLAITPQPRVPGEAVAVQPGNQLAVKLEGVIQHGTLPVRFRPVRKVLLTVTTQLQTRSQHSADGKTVENGTTLTQAVDPHNDFFTAQFLLAFPSAGLHILSIEASMVDESDIVWHTGPRTTLSVKAYDEGGSKGAQAAAAAAAVAAVQQARQGYPSRV